MLASRFWIGSAADETPNVFVERAELFLHVEKLLGIRDRRRDLQAIADDSRIGNQFLDSLGREAGDLFGIKISERPAIRFALAKHHQPTQAGLSAFERQKLELLLVVVDRHAPLRVVVGHHQLAAAPAPACFTAPSYLPSVVGFEAVGVFVFFVCVMFFRFDKLPVVPFDVGERGVALDRRTHSRQVEAIRSAESILDTAPRRRR